MKKTAKRALSLIMAMVLVVSLFSGFTFPENSGDGSEAMPYQVGDTVINDGTTEPEGFKAENTYWARTDVPASNVLVCEKHDHEFAMCDDTCEEPDHSHSVEEGCFESVEAYTLWTLCAYEGLAFAPAPLADTEYTVTFTAKSGSSTLRYVEIMITDANGATVDYVEINRNGRATYDLPAGTYTAIISYTSGSYVYYGEETFTVTDADIPVDIDVTATYDANAAYKSTYDRTTYFNHVDIRVKGTYTTGTTIDLTTYNIRLANVSISVVNPSEYSRYDFSQRFTDNSETYEWRKTGVRVYKGATVSLTCDIYDSVTGAILKSGFSHSFSGEAEFIKAIAQCDMHQGLDFIINPQEIIEAVFYGVRYDWDVVDANGDYFDELPAGLATLPAATGDIYEAGDSHTIDTHHTEGHYVIDEANGKVYTFDGWDWWSLESDNNLKKNVIASDATDVTVNEETVIYGVWTVTDLAKADSHITITKKFVDSEGNALTAPEGYHVLLTGPRGGSLEIPISAFTLSNGVYGYQLPVYTDGEYTVEEHEYEIAGYTAAAAIAVSESADAITADHDHVTAGEGSGNSDSASFTLVLDYEGAGACAHIGQVDFVNTYTKKTGEAIHNYPNLAINKLDADTRVSLSGAVFVLYSDAAMTQAVATGTSDESGYLYFRNLQPGIYYLNETTAPEGYVPGGAIYRVTVALKNGFPTQILSNGAWCDYYEYTMSVEYSLDGGVTWEASQHFSLGTTGNRYRLAAFNEKVKGELTITKSFVGLDDTHIPASVTVTLTRPDGSTTDHVLNKENEWKVTLEELPLGTYTVRETAASISGYSFIGVEGAGEVEISVKNLPNNYDPADPVAEVSVALKNSYEKITKDVYEWPELTVWKVRDADGKALAGAVFNLGVYENGALDSYRGGVTTGADGKATYTDVGSEFTPTEAPEVGDVLKTFHFYEYMAPAGYSKHEGVYKVELVVESITEAAEPDANNTFHKVYKIGLRITDTYTNAPVNLENGALVVENTKNSGSLTVKKTFGVNNAYMPNEIRATVKGPDAYSESITLNAANGWTVTLTGLALGDYTVEEQDIEEEDGKVLHNGHLLHTVSSVTTASVTLASGVENGVDLSEQTATLVNTYISEVNNPAAFQIKKVDSATGAVITSDAEFTLYSDEACTQVVKVENTGSDGIASFAGFTEAATYYLKETAAPENYVSSDTKWEITVSLKEGDPQIKVNLSTNIWESIYNWITGVDPDSTWADGVLTVENTKKTGKLTVTKTVEGDVENQYTNAAYSITLDCSDNSLDQTFSLKAGESKTIENIPYGTSYTVSEDTTGAAFTSVISDNGSGKVEVDEIAVEIKNSYVYMESCPGLNLLKLNADTKEPIEGVEFTVYSDAACTTEVGSGETDAEGKLTLSGFSFGTATYYLKETKQAEGYHPNDAAYTVTAETAYTVKNAGTANAYTEKALVLTAGLTKSGDSYVVENTPIKEIEISVLKEWDDGGYHARPESVTAVIYRDNQAFDEQILNEENDWKYNWSGAAYTDEYTWSVDEKTVPEGYTKNVTNSGNAWTITNSRTPKDIEISVEKAWNHNGGKNLPDSIVVTLYKDDVAYDTQTLSEANGWKHTWTGLTDVSEWRVDETQVPTGYEKEVTFEGYDFVITNTRTINEIEVSVTKEWVASEGVVHPESVEAVLYKDGQEFKTVKLSADNNWTYTWEDLTDEYTWSVDEKEVPEGYTKNVTNSGTDFTITNTLNSKEIDISVKKLWAGAGAAKPDSVKIVLYRDGKEFKSVTLSDKNNWSYVWEDLTDEFEWTVDEPSVPSGYYKYVSSDGNYNFTVTNTHVDVPKTGDNSQIGLWAGLFAAFTAGAAGILFLGKKKKKEEN
ncbi:MAG: Cna B-type domain-containing protein [Ruminococcaceae bacterium]|nr:Cna B-type domain-containing protein [Oscillospiraceae bacterium]